MTSEIGTYGEKSLHRELKWLLEPTGALHEAPVCGYVADIKTDAGITEIQTQSFHLLRGKLTAYLAENTVTLVYPIAREKQILWTDGNGGIKAGARRSPKRGGFYDAFGELYRIKSFLTDPNLRIKLMLIDVSELRSETKTDIKSAPTDMKYAQADTGRRPAEDRADTGRRPAEDRADAGRRAVKKRGWRKGYRKVETVIRSYYDELTLVGPMDYIKLIPESLRGSPTPFTSADYGAAAGLNRRNAGIAMNVLYHVGVVERTGKRGNFILYQITGAADTGGAEPVLHKN